MAKLDWVKQNAKNKAWRERNYRPEKDFQKILKTAYELEQSKIKKERKAAGLPIIGIADLDIALDWILFDTRPTKSFGSVNKLAEIKKYAAKYKQDKRLTDNQTLLVFRTYLLKQNILKNYDEDKGKLTTLIITILYNKFFQPGTNHS